ncbi:MAG TPA: hypothetical protein VIM62_00250, partial [Acidobacteriaceae bacterium]
RLRQVGVTAPVLVGRGLGQRRRQELQHDCESHAYGDAFAADHAALSKITPRSTNTGDGHANLA